MDLLLAGLTLVIILIVYNLLPDRPKMGCKCPEDNGPYCSCWIGK